PHEAQVPPPAVAVSVMDLHERALVAHGRSFGHDQRSDVSSAHVRYVAVRAELIRRGRELRGLWIFFCTGDDCLASNDRSVVLWVHDDVSCQSGPEFVEVSRQRGTYPCVDLGSHSGGDGV